MRSVTSNGVAIPFDDRHFAPMVDSTELLDDPVALRQRYRRDGYLYLRAVLDPDRLRRLRHSYFSMFDPRYLDQHHPVEAGIFSGLHPTELAPHGTPGHPAHRFVRSPQFTAFAGDKTLAELAATVLGAPCHVLPRQIVRHFDRSSCRASRAHRDRRYLDEGSDRLLTMWIPLLDVPLATGGLIYLEDSADPNGVELAVPRRRTDRPDDRRAISHDLAWVAEQMGRRWLWRDFEAGDITVHSPWIVHATLDTTTDAMRLSADLRFLVDGAAPDRRWLAPWSGDDGY